MKIMPVMLVLLAFYCMGCSAKKDNGKTYNQNYTIGDIPDLSDFFAYNDNEKNLIESLKKNLPAPGDTGNQQGRDYVEIFRNNRARIFMDIYTNNLIQEQDSANAGGMPCECNCYFEKDSLFIGMGIGFFGGIGFDISLTENKFQSAYFIYTDDVKPYKSELSDTAFSDQALAKSKYQYLVLDKKPLYKEGEQLTGYLTMTSKNYYAKNQDNHLDSGYVISKIYFTCKTKKKGHIFNW